MLLHLLIKHASMENDETKSSKIPGKKNSESKLKTLYQ